MSGRDHLHADGKACEQGRPCSAGWAHPDVPSMQQAPLSLLGQPCAIVGASSLGPGHWNNVLSSFCSVQATLAVPWLVVTPPQSLSSCSHGFSLWTHPRPNVPFLQGCPSYWVRHPPYPNRTSSSLTASTRTLFPNKVTS